jgi:hypothetical protein
VFTSGRAPSPALVCALAELGLALPAPSTI